MLTNCNEKQKPATPNRRQAVQSMAAIVLAGTAGVAQTASQTGSASAPAGTSSGAGRSLGCRIRGVQHFGITVQNMNRAFEFYAERCWLIRRTSKPTTTCLT